MSVTIGGREYDFAAKCIDCDEFEVFGDAGGRAQWHENHSGEGHTVIYSMRAVRRWR